MQQGIHPDYHPVEVTCSCGNTFVTRTAGKEDHMFVDVCSQCHPFYTGKQKILDTGGRVARFEKRYGKKSKYFTPVRFDLACSGIPDRGLAFFVFFDKFCCSIDLRNRIIEQNSTIQKKVCYGRRTVPGGGNRA